MASKNKPVLTFGLSEHQNNDAGFYGRRFHFTLKQGFFVIIIKVSLKPFTSIVELNYNYKL
jgi:hypothetical protein